MASHTEYLSFTTERRRDYVNITDRVEEGMALVYVNDAEQGLIDDIGQRPKRVIVKVLGDRP